MNGLGIKEYRLAINALSQVASLFKWGEFEKRTELATQPAQPELQPNGALVINAQSVELATPSPRSGTLSVQSGKSNSQSATADSQSGALGAQSGTLGDQSGTTSARS
ncbi:hypothetical protein PI124_g16924 [Phytophthora idaei]|nr:hypothetical protein PI124_g16924 [Phytophthora idaei]